MIFNKIDPEKMDVNEKRIYNNIKVAYDNKLLDINSLLGGEHRDTGVTKKHIDRVILSDFVQWSKLIDQDYTLHNFFDRGNSFTFNYAGSTGPSGKMLPGFWRQIYQQAYDTDRPHTHPWEMLGFSVMPTWWETQYGPAPYTKENLLLWQDLEAGIVRQPNVKYKTNSNCNDTIGFFVLVIVIKTLQHTYLTNTQF